MALFSLSSLAADIRTVEDEQGTFSITTTPKRIVVLEYSFVDALAAVEISPVGIADDNNPERIIPQVRKLIQPWTSVGTRSQPSLEVISELKPDLIIADVQRHSAIYDDLKTIAPTLILKSRGESYKENLISSQKIGVVVNQDDKMQRRIDQHNNTMMRYKKELESFSGTTVQFAVTTDKGMWLHSPVAYAGGVIDVLGLSSPMPNENKVASVEITLEQLLKLNPDYLLEGRYTKTTVLDHWKKQPLYQLLKINNDKQLIDVSAPLWSLSRGMLAAEGMAENLTNIVK
ncbi:Fe(3+) dicitrate ABC transporter substrate-binding protein [Vibrio sp.]|nr:Fe(3+) dicitrate ABC transporter substrate-binding protein [Vibrio sp.]